MHIWRDNRLPIPTTHQVQSPVKVLESNACVTNLIDPDSKNWNRQLITQVFNNEESKTICNIPLSCFGAVDKITWWPAKNGTFSVMPAYALELDRGRSDLVGTSNALGEVMFRKTM